eukprot:TRINITY_DN1610_c0_g1_i4.p1 TRINITY_DN1610_c0_g1~~TRINITY_DN1610_c0_g1_i4.p1  ORF type:complete len:177 (-),score=0.80 TRINITY_DN1610_c0_g1_i4:136-615(-)
MCIRDSFITQITFGILIDTNSTFSENKSLSRLPKEIYGKVEIRLNQKFTIDLPLNISDGYAWCLWKRHGSKITKFEESNKFGTYTKLFSRRPRKKDQVKLRQHFTFLPVRVGKSVLEFWHIQPWLNHVKHKYKILVEVNCFKSSVNFSNSYRAIIISSC